MEVEVVPTCGLLTLIGKQKSRKRPWFGLSVAQNKDGQCWLATVASFGGDSYLWEYTMYRSTQEGVGPNPRSGPDARTGFKGGGLEELRIGLADKPKNRKRPVGWVWPWDKTVATVSSTKNG